MARPRLEVADVIRAHGAAWRKANAGHVGLGQLKVMSAIETCRTAALGGHVERCEDCAHEHVAYNSCRNRHCPKCQGRGGAAMARRARSRTPCRSPTITSSLLCRRRSARSRSRTRPPLYDLLFRSAADTLLTIAADPKHLGARIGLTARPPHLGLGAHPSSATSTSSFPVAACRPDGSRWTACKPGFFLPVRVLSRLFRRLS